MATFIRTVHAAILAIAAMSLSGAAALAQNYDAQHQVRTGFMFQPGFVTGSANEATSAQSGSFDFGTLGLGATAGLEWVNRHGTSWGVEIDGVAMQGNGRPLAQNFGADYLATVRLRAGRHVRQDLFWYATAGLGALGVEARIGGQFGNLIKVSDTKVGVVLGTGLEWDFGAGLLFGEYLYGSFGSLHATTTSSAYTFDGDIHAFRLGVKFKVGHDHFRYDDDVARRIGRAH